MQEDYSTFSVPSFARKEVYDFGATKESYEIFKELSAISEEIERCRARNS